MLGIFPAIFWLAMASGALSAVMHGRVPRPAREAQRVECSQPSALELPEVFETGDFANKHTVCHW